jgi:hypothetical protein
MRANLKKAFKHRFSCRCTDCNESVAEYLPHLGYLSSLVCDGILNDTERVDPEVPKPQLHSYSDGISDGLRKVRHRDSIHILREVLLQQRIGLLVTPTIAEGSIGSFLSIADEQRRVIVKATRVGVDDAAGKWNNLRFLAVFVGFCAFRDPASCLIEC